MHFYCPNVDSHNKKQLKHSVLHKSSSGMIYETISEIYENVTKIFNNKKSSQMLHLTLNMSNAQKRFKVSQKLMKIPCLKLF